MMSFVHVQIVLSGLGANKAWSEPGIGALQRRNSGAGLPRLAGKEFHVTRMECCHRQSLVEQGIKSVADA